jgi:ceramide glucosyltransferase
VLYFLPELVSGAALPLIAAAYLAFALGWSIAAALLCFAAIWYGAEMLLASVAGWHLTLLYPLHGLVRDALLPIIWINAWLGSDFVWRGNAMSVEDDAVPADLTATD